MAFLRRLSGLHDRQHCFLADRIKAFTVITSDEYVIANCEDDDVRITGVAIIGFMT